MAALSWLSLIVRSGSNNDVTALDLVLAAGVDETEQSGDGHNR